MSVVAINTLYRWMAAPRASPGAYTGTVTPWRSHPKPQRGVVPKDSRHHQPDAELPYGVH